MQYLNAKWLLVATLFILILPSAASAAQLWVNTERLNRRTCPSESCGIVGQLFFREAVTVLETRDGWARVSEPYDASCANGRSQYVDSGNSQCSRSNGIVDDRFSEWVLERFLSAIRPGDPAAGAQGVEKLISGSDDFARYRAVFVQAAQRLIADKRCVAADFEEMGGWVKSSNHGNSPIYFTYCGGLSLSNRIYLNAKTGETYQ
jgi:hypothetical protein